MISERGCKIERWLPICKRINRSKVRKKNRYRPGNGSKERYSKNDYINFQMDQRIETSKKGEIDLQNNKRNEAAKNGDGILQIYEEIAINSPLFCFSIMNETTTKISGCH